MRKIIFLLILGASLAQAQTGNGAFPQKQYYASDYGAWQIPSQTANTYIFSPPSACIVSQPSTSSPFDVFSTNAPILIRDASPSASEVVTPSNVISNSSFCGVIVSPIRNHTSFTLMSATGGLQEVLNQIPAAIPYSVEVDIDRNWYVAIQAVPGATAAGLIASVKGNLAAYLVDKSQAPFVWYTWSGSQYVAVTIGSSGIAGTTQLNHFALGAGSSSVKVSTATDDGTTTTINDTGGLVSPKYTWGNVGSGNYGLLSGSDAFGNLSLQIFSTTLGGTTLDAGGLYSQNIEGTYLQGGALLISGISTQGTIQNGVPASPINILQNGGGAIALNIEGGVAIAGPVRLPTAQGTDGVAGQALLSQGPGQTPLWGSVSTPSVAGSTITPGIVNGVVSAAGINGAGIGVAQSAWSSSTSYAQCRAVSYLSANYIAAAPSTNVTPGTNSAVWYPVPTPGTPTAGDCGFYLAASTVSGTTGAQLLLPPGNTNTCIGFVEPTVTSPGNPVVAILGAGKQASVLTQTCSISNAVITQPNTGVAFAFAGLDLEGFTVNANFLAPADINVYGAQQFKLAHLRLTNPTDGSDHYIEFGHPSSANHTLAWTYEPELDDIDTLNSHGPGSGAAFTVTVSGGAPTITVTNGGSSYTSAYTQLVLSGSGANADVPCTSRGTDTFTISSGVITAVTTTATGCSSTLFANAFGGNRVTYGFKFNDTSDAKFITSLTPSEANTGIYVSNVSSQMKFTASHPISTYTGIYDAGNNVYIATQIDSVYRYGFDLEGETNIDTIVGTDFEYSTYLPGATDYHIGHTSGSPSTAPYQISIYGNICGNAPSFGGYYHYITPSGGGNSFIPAFVHPADDFSCDQINAVAGPNYTGNWSASGSITAAGTLYGNNGVADLKSVNQSVLAYQLNDVPVVASALSSGQFLTDDASGDNDIIWNGSHNLRFGIASSLTSAYFDSAGVFHAGTVDPLILNIGASALAGSYLQFWDHTNAGQNSQVQMNLGSMNFSNSNGFYVFTAPSSTNAMSVQEAGSPFASATYWFRGASTDSTGLWFKSPLSTNIELGDTGGVDALNVKNSSGTTEASINSQGQVTATLVTSPISGSETVASSATPTFSTAFGTSYTVLTGNITTFTLVAGTDGQQKTLCFKQGASAFTLAGPTNVHGLGTIGTGVNEYNCQQFVFNNANTIWLASGPMATNQ